VLYLPIKTKKMEAIRQTVKVKNHKINITLPDDFNADEVDVIILPSSAKYEIPQWQIDEVRERTKKYLKNPEIALDFDEAMKEIEDGI
jgi:hypothetical protein